LAERVHLRGRSAAVAERRLLVLQGRREHRRRAALAPLLGQRRDELADAERLLLGRNRGIVAQTSLGERDARRRLLLAEERLRGVAEHLAPKRDERREHRVLVAGVGARRDELPCAGTIREITIEERDRVVRGR